MRKKECRVWLHVVDLDVGIEDLAAEVARTRVVADLAAVGAHHVQIVIATLQGALERQMHAPFHSFTPSKKYEKKTALGKGALDTTAQRCEPRHQNYCLLKPGS